MVSRHFFQCAFERSWRPVLFALLAHFLFSCTDAADSQDAVDKQNPSKIEAGANPDIQIGTASTSAETLTPERMGQWSRNCALCHVRGEGGAPVLGDRDAWTARLEQGEDTLLRHTLEGLNNMPPLGYCMDCEQDDFLALIRFMGGDA